MRYFLTTNASLPYVAGGYTFTFEPVQNRGGSWLGVLAVAEDAAASALALASLQNIDEIDFENYDRIKKKLVPTQTASSASPMPQQQPAGVPVGAVRLVEPQGRTHGVGNPLIPRPAAPVPVIETVELQSTSAEPPAEPLLDAPSISAPKRYTAKPRA